MSRVTPSGSQSTTLDPAAEATHEAASTASPSATPTPSSAATVEPYRDTIGKVTTSLTRSWSDLIITDRDVAKVHDALEKLPPAQYRQSIEELDRHGLLERYINEMNAGAREQFLRQAVRKGMLKEVGGSPEDERRDPAGKPQNPPTIPKVLRSPSDAPGVLKELAMKSNERVICDYEAAYFKYIERYEAILSRATHPSTLRELGEPVMPHTFREVPLYVAPFPNRLNVSVSNRYNELLGRVPSGFVAQSKTAGVLVGPSTEAKAELEVTRLPGNVIQVKTEKALEGDVGAGGATIGTDNKRDLRIGAAGQEVKISRDGKVEFESTVAVGQRGVAEVKGGAKVVADGAANTLLGGVTFQARFGPLAVEQDLLFGFRGVQSDVADRVAQDDPMGIFHPPELAAGKRWSELSEERRYILSIRHSEKSWNDALDARARASLKR